MARRTRLGTGLIAAFAIALLARDRNVVALDACEDQARLVLPHAKISLAQTVAAGAFVPPGSNASAAAYRSLPAFCRVAATLTPSTDSDIKIEVWLPADGWNRKILAVGNGAFSGAIAYSAMASSLARGYATASTDTGHSGGSAEFGLGHPEKVIDFGWRAVHEMTTASKAIVSSFYADAAEHAYWNGCSAGGRQAMKEAQRFPTDFDGIIAGSPGLDWTGRAAQAVRVAQALEPNQAARLPRAQRELLHKAVLAACDGTDGVTDGVVDQPDKCSFDPSVLQCAESSTSSGSGAACLSPAQVATAKLIYSSPDNPRSSRAITGLARGSELGWTDLGWTASARATGLDQFRFLVFGDPAWTIGRFTFDADIVRAEETDADTINALDPNLAPFIAAGGKLIQYHGWADPQISPSNSTQYYSRVLDRIGASRAAGAYRLFMAPGMGHCSGGDGPNSFDMLTELEHWVERGAAPTRVIASHSTGGAVDRTRPLCPYPQVAVYQGKGSTDDAANFACRAGARAAERR